MEDVKARLLALADPKQQQFHSKLCPGLTNILGVRTPQMRALAKELARGDFRSYLETARDDSYEETLLQGMVIGYGKMDLQERLERIAGFVPKINNWATCDLFCTSLSFVRKNQQTVWEFLQSYLRSTEEFSLRFGIVMLLDYFITEDYIDIIFPLLDAVRHDGYYVKMAVAWAISICYVRFPEKTMAFLKNNHLDDFTYNKALQKTCESLRVSDEEKMVLRSMKRKKAKH